MILYIFNLFVFFIFIFIFIYLLRIFTLFLHLKFDNEIVCLIIIVEENPVSIFDMFKF